MIIRESLVDGKQFIFHQVDHAKSSGDLFPFLLDQFYDEELAESLHETCTRHDDGWIETDKKDQQKPLCKQVHFPDVENKRHADIWRKSVQALANDKNYYGAACLAEHAHSLSDEKKALQEELIIQRIDFLRKAFPDDSPEVRSWRLQRGFMVLQLTDLATLMTCSGWVRNFSMPLLDHEARQHDISMLEVEPWTVKIDPWVFNKSSIEIPLNTFVFPPNLLKGTEPIDWSEYQEEVTLKLIQ